MSDPFSSEGIEKDVSRWLRKMGYRGTGLKKESLIPICKGVMRDAWKALMVSYQPVSMVTEMRTKVGQKMERMAAHEMRCKIEEKANERSRKIESIRTLEQRSSQQDQQIEKLKARLHQLRQGVQKKDVKGTHQRSNIDALVQKAMLSDVFSLRLNDSERQIQEQIKTIEKFVHEKRKAQNEDKDSGYRAYESIMSIVHDFTIRTLHEKLQNRLFGQKLNLEEILPDWTHFGKTKEDSQRLIGEFGRWYKQHVNRLSHSFGNACCSDYTHLVQFEALYQNSWKRMDVEWDRFQKKAVEDMQIAHIKAFNAMEEMKESDKKEWDAFRKSPEVKKFFHEVEKANCREWINAKIDMLCLQDQNQLLDAEIEKLREQLASINKKEHQETIELYKKLQFQIEQSYQLDIIIQFYMNEIQRLQREFEEKASQVRMIFENGLIPGLSKCLEAFRLCKDVFDNEFQKFKGVNLSERAKHISLSETADSHILPLPQRFELAANEGPGRNYWTASIHELMTEMKLALPLVKIESAESFFKALTDALRFSLANLVHLDHFQKLDAQFLSHLSTMQSESAIWMMDESERKTETESALKDVDELFSIRHAILNALRTTIPEALKDFEHQPAFHSVPWLTRNGMNLPEWMKKCNRD